MVKFELTGKEKKTEYFLPTSWKEVTVEKFLKLRDAGNDFIPITSVLSGAPIEDIRKTKQWDFDIKLMPLLEWINDVPKLDKLDTPKTITYKEKEYKIPKNLETFTLEQKITAQSRMREIQEAKGDMLDVVPFIASVYLQPILTGEDYSDERAEAFVSEINNFKITEIYPISAFFFKILIEYNREREKHLLLSRVRISWLRGLIRLMFLRSSKRLMNSHRVTRLTMIKS